MYYEAKKSKGLWCNMWRKNNRHTLYIFKRICKKQYCLIDLDGKIGFKCLNHTYVKIYTMLASCPKKRLKRAPDRALSFHTLGKKAKKSLKFCFIVLLFPDFVWREWECCATWMWGQSARIHTRLQTQLGTQTSSPLYITMYKRTM